MHKLGNHLIEGGEVLDLHNRASQITMAFTQVNLVLMMTVVVVVVIIYMYMYVFKYYCGNCRVGSSH